LERAADTRYIGADPPPAFFSLTLQRRPFYNPRAYPPEERS
jgi:hypothetical protein